LYINILNFINSLSLEQKAALAKISLTFSILITMISIVGIFVGDRIIDYFQLEGKFPRWAKYFELRRKFQFYDYIWNTSIILFMILILLSFNIFV
jgi:hypothetical protein